MKISNLDNDVDEKSKNSKKNISNKGSQQSFNLNISQIKIEQEINKNNNNINNNQINNNIEQPKNEIKSEINNIDINIPKIDVNQNNNIKSINVSNDGNNSKILSQRGTSRKKNKGLPLVGSKNNKFEMSKLGYAGQFDINSVNLNILKSTNVGVNGVKIGDRIIE